MRILFYHHRLIFLFFLALFIGFFLPLAALAQLGQSKAPIMINSDSQVYHRNENKSVLTGHVNVQQGTDRLKADKITIYYSDAQQDGPGNIKKIIAEKNVIYLTENEIIRGDEGIYDADKNMIQLIGNVVLVQNKTNILNGYRLTYSLDTETVRIEGKTKTDRVRAIYYPDKSNTQQNPFSFQKEKHKPSPNPKE